MLLQLVKYVQAEVAHARSQAELAQQKSQDQARELEALQRTIANLRESLETTR